MFMYIESCCVVVVVVVVYFRKQDSVYSCLHCPRSLHRCLVRPENRGGLHLSFLYLTLLVACRRGGMLVRSLLELQLFARNKGK